MALIFLDTQKAFDNMNWQFMIQQIKTMYFDKNLINAIETIYNEQIAKIMVNDELTEKINILKKVLDRDVHSFHYYLY